MKKAINYLFLVVSMLPVTLYATSGIEAISMQHDHEHDSHHHAYESRVLSEKDIEALKVGPDLNIVRLYVPNDSGEGKMSAGVENLKASSRIPQHIHKDMEEIIYIVSGSGKVVINDKETAIKAGDLVLATPGTAHGFLSTGDVDLKMFLVYSKNDMMDFFRDYSFKDKADVQKRLNRDFMVGLFKKHKDAFIVPKTVKPVIHDDQKVQR